MIGWLWEYGVMINFFDKKVVKELLKVVDVKIIKVLKLR